jgi:hypothetical protein
VVWWSRRDPSIRLPWADAIQHVADIPYLAQHVQLLLKSKAPRRKDDLDAEVVIPALTRPQRGWLSGHLPRDHLWQRIVHRSNSAG